MKIKNILVPIVTLLLVIIAFSSCEEDFEIIANEIVGDVDNDAELDDSKTVIAYRKKLLSVQSNNLPAYQLGVYNDQVFGKSTLSLVSQLVMSANDPAFGDDDENFPVVLDSVFLYVPFFSEVTILNEGTDEETREYELDSVFGNQPIQLSLYESNYFLRSIDPETDFQELQKYYSNFRETFTDEFKGDLLYTNNDFTPTNEGFVLKRVDDTTLTKHLSPGIRVALPISFFEEKIINQQGTPELLNNNNFQEYFRGVFFDIEENNNEGTLVIFDFENADITLHYNFDREVADTDDDDGDGDITELIIKNIQEEFILNFSGVNVNMFNNEGLPELPEPDILNGEENLYLKGGNGFITVIDLFGEEDLIHFENGNEVSGSNEVPDELDRLREDKWLINEANLKFYVNQSVIEGGDTEPERLIIYDINNGTVLLDYGLDTSTETDILDAKNIHLGRLQRDSDGLGDYYKIKITNHISNLINKDSTNVLLGLMITQNVNRGGFQSLETPILLEEDLNNSENNIFLNEVPSAAIVSPEGTVLHGNASTNEEKRLKLQIYYTEPN